MVDNPFGGETPLSTTPKAANAESAPAAYPALRSARPKLPGTGAAPVTVEFEDTAPVSTAQASVAASNGRTVYTMPRRRVYTPVSADFSNPVRIDPQNRRWARTQEDLAKKQIAAVTEDFSYVPEKPKTSEVEESTLSDYEIEKERLRAAAEAEFLHNTTDWGQTMIRNFAVNPDAPYMAGLINYLQLLLQSPNGVAYERYTAAEQEAEKEQKVEEITEWANKNGHSPLLSAIYGEDTNGILNLPSGISLLTAPLQGADYLLDLYETAYVGEPLPSSVPDITETTQALRGGVSQNMSGAGQFVYHTAMSAADSLIANAIGGDIGGAIILGLGAASNAAHDIKSRGGTDEQALLGGAVSGILEGVFEKISLGQLKAMKTVPVESLRDVVINIAKSVLTNAGEEASTEIANTIFDTIFMGELSTYSMTVESYLSQGNSESRARWLAIGDTLKRIGESALSGALMGVLFGGGASAESYYRSQQAAQGEAKLRSMEMPEPELLDALGISEPEARGAMVLLNLDQFDDTAGYQTENSIDSGSKADVLEKNRLQGKLYEQDKFAEFSSQYSNAVEQITIRTKENVRTRVDAIGLDEEGNVVIYEFKSSSTARLTKNQKIAFQEILLDGGVVTGRGKGIFTGGYQIPAGTPIIIIRPK